MDINFAEHAQSREVVPDGTYRVKLKRYEKVLAKSGTEQIRWYAEITHPEERMGGSLVDHLQLLDSTAWKIASFIKAALCWGPDEMKALGKLRAGSERFNKLMDMCKGREMWWVVIIDTYGGNRRNKVSDYAQEPDQTGVDVEDLDDVPEFLKD